MVHMESPSSWKIVKLVFLAKSGRCPEEGDQKLQCTCADIGDVEVVCIMYYSVDREKEPENWKNMHVGLAFASDGDECIAKLWEWEEERNPVLRHGSVVRPTVYLASLDIKTAFDEAKPKHVAQILDYHDTHGWLIAALFREMSGLEGKAMFECVENSFVFNRSLRQESVEAPRLWQKMATQILANGGRRMGEEKNG